MKPNAHQASAMNNTKWDELRLAFYSLGRLAPAWRTKSLASEFISPWDSEWFYHLKAGGYEDIEWLEVRSQSEEQRKAIHEILTKVHVPAELTESGFRIFGYLQQGQSAAFLAP